MSVAGREGEIEDARRLALCTCAERSDCGRAAEERDELASPHDPLRRQTNHLLKKLSTLRAGTPKRADHAALIRPRAAGRRSNPLPTRLGTYRFGSAMASTPRSWVATASSPIFFPIACRPRWRSDSGSRHRCGRRRLRCCSPAAGSICALRRARSGWSAKSRRTRRRRQLEERKRSQPR